MKLLLLQHRITKLKKIPSAFALTPLFIYSWKAFKNVLLQLQNNEVIQPIVAEEYDSSEARLLKFKIESKQNSNLDGNCRCLEKLGGLVVFAMH